MHDEPEECIKGYSETCIIQKNAKHPSGKIIFANFLHICSLNFMLPLSTRSESSKL